MVTDAWNVDRVTEFCEKYGLLTKTGQLSASAENLYRFITKGTLEETITVGGGFIGGIVALSFDKLFLIEERYYRLHRIHKLHLTHDGIFHILYYKML